MNPDDFIVSSDPSRLDVDFIHDVLQRTYWAKGRPRAVVEASIRHSICFGVYERASGRQVGFARLVTDQVTFSWLADVVIDESWRGRGLGKLLMSAITAHPVMQKTMCLLGTADAHGLYERFGFARSEQMKRFPPKAAAAPAERQPDGPPPGEGSRVPPG